MKRIYSAETLVQVAHMKNVLAAHGIRAELRNARLAGAVGEIPFLETWPQLWVDELFADWARELVEQELREAEEPVQDWDCPACGERIEGQFAVCWNCGSMAGGAAP